MAGLRREVRKEVMESRCMEVAALGRPLYPGMLYDCRSDSFIPGVTLWDKNALRDDLDVHQKPKTHLKFATSDSLSDKANLLDIKASLKASFLGGLVEVGGSAKYLLDTKSSERQCRVTMQYSQTTKFEQLTMKELGNITYPQVFDQKTATHVVTAVLYGAQVFMVFDYIKAENKNKQDIEGNLHAMVKKIPKLSLDGEASLKMTEDEKEMAENISVTVYGDIELEENPTTFKEALEVYKKAPALMKQQQDKGVPLTVWLYPLNLLDSKAAKLVREISLSQVCETESLLEELGEMERICNDLIKRQITDDFPDLKDRLLNAAIRGGTQEDKALGDILNIHYTSPFNAYNMNKWLDDITSELEILSSYTSGLKDLTVAKSSGSFNSICFQPDIDVVVCLSFTSLNKSEVFTILGQTSERDFLLQAAQHWFNSPDISAKMRQNLSLFTTFLKVNKNEKKFKFIIASISDPSNLGISIRLYQNGLLTDPKFQPVSKPPKPVVETSDGKVTLKLSKSPTGKTVHFRVEYKIKPSTDSATDVEEWTVKDTSNSENIFILTGLQLREQYWVRYRAVSNVGVSEASDSVPFTFCGKLDVTVGKWNFSIPILINELRCKILTTIGMSRWSPSTIKTEVMNVVNNPIIPYTVEIPGGLKEGMALYLQGVASQSCRLMLDFATGPKGDGITFNFSSWFNLIFGKRGLKCFTISGGSAFDIFFMKSTEGYEIYLNGQRSSRQFDLSIPVENVTTLKMSGKVIMNTVGIVENWSTSTFGKEMNTGISRTKLSDIQSDVPHPVCNPRNPYSGSIPGGLRPGLVLLFQGVVPSDGDCFEINLQTGPKYLHDIALQLKQDKDSVVLNSREKETWGNEEKAQVDPFVRGAAFDIIMLIKPKCYKVMVNGLKYCKFRHCIPVNTVTTLHIKGDVFMNTFGTAEVDDINLKVTVTNPANI
ncbi:hypothetical protein KOW79_020807 [Hemibagrus wyckioides]|uniref:Uncharacterized protein n=1 Tax=Hemibagrus wyckioides TaxID=337641 RepID=A0A9D3N3J7_9TELE|nr:hypothetical protein KOW79_020807 [Hemibagrus wyckioides]